MILEHIFMTLMGFYLSHTPLRDRNQNFINALSYLAGNKMECQELIGEDYKKIQDNMQSFLDGHTPKDCK